VDATKQSYINRTFVNRAAEIAEKGTAKWKVKQWA